MSMLENEKYKGDALLQKSYTVDFLTKKRTQNKGEIQMYYVEDDHEAIISKRIWECVQLEAERRKKYEWNRISRSDRLLLGTLFLNHVKTFKGSIVAVEKTSSGQQQYRKV